MVNGIGAVFRGFRRSQFRVTFRPDDETVAGHRRRTGCADILGARASGPHAVPRILGAWTSWVRGPLARMRYPESWERGHPGCAGLWPAIRSILTLPRPWWELEGGEGEGMEMAGTCLRRQSTQRSDASYADRVTRVSSSKLRPSCIMVKG